MAAETPLTGHMGAEPLHELGSPFESLDAYDAAYTPMGEELGRGASGVVRRANRKSDGLGVAVKTIDLRALRVMGGFSINRLRREVQVMLGLRHPNIVELYGAYGNSDNVRLVMELVEGQELFDAILSRGKLSEAEARPIFGSLCAAVAYMHGRGVIHRDLKPENVLLRQSTSSVREVKLVDFGLSKLIASHRGGSAARTMVGTPSYLAPEIEEMKSQQRSIDLDAISEEQQQPPPNGNSSKSEDESPAPPNQAHSSGSYDAKVDAWSLGVTLYVMLIARFPVYKRTAAGLIAGVVLPTEANSLSPQARSLIVRLLEANPIRRISAAEALKDAWLETTVAKLPSLALALAQQQPSIVAVEQRQQQQAEATEELAKQSFAADAVPQHPHAVFCGLASAHASLVAAAALQLPPEMRRAGLVYHERVLASRGLAAKLRSTATLVLDTLDDLACAVEEKQPHVARHFLADIKRWTADLGTECAKAKADNLKSMRDLADTAGLALDALPAASHHDLDQSSHCASRPPATLELTCDQDVLELMLPVTTVEPHEQHQRVTTADLAQPIPPLLKCLGELHVVFARIELFWSKVEVSLDTILRRNEALETLVSFSDTPKIKSRFDTRLEQCRDFWSALASWQIDQHDVHRTSARQNHQPVVESPCDAPNRSE